MRPHDDYALNGQWHYCSDCGTRWSDADGGCQCTEPSEEEEDQDERVAMANVSGLYVCNRDAGYYGRQRAK